MEIPKLFNLKHVKSVINSYGSAIVDEPTDNKDCYSSIKSKIYDHSLNSYLNKSNVNKGKSKALYPKRSNVIKSQRKLKFKEITSKKLSPHIINMYSCIS